MRPLLVLLGIAALGGQPEGPLGAAPPGHDPVRGAFHGSFHDPFHGPFHDPFHGPFDGAPGGDDGDDGDDDDAPLLAQLSGSAAGLFLRLVNEQLQGRIDPRAVSFEAPAGVVLEDTVLTAPGNRPVARVKRVRADISLKALLGGEIAISKIEVDEPQLILEVKDGKLNLLEALTPKKKKDPDPNNKAEGTFRIDDIYVRNGGFRLTDTENVTLVFDDINGRASLDVDLGRAQVIVDVKDVRIKSGAVKLAALDVPLKNLVAEHVKVITDRVELNGVSGTALGGASAFGGDGASAAAKGGTANFSANGRINVKAPGKLEIKGKIDAAADAWPDRLAQLPFHLPTLSGDVAVDGAFADPQISVVANLGKVDLYGYPVESAVANVLVNKTRVVVKDGTRFNIARGGVLRASGEVKLPVPDAKVATVNLDLRARVERAPLATVLLPAKLDTPMRGSLNASVRISGPAGGDAGKATDLLIDGDLAGKSLELYDVRLGSEVEGDVRVRVSPSKVALEKISLGDPLGGLAVRVNGDIDLKGEQLQLSVNANVDDAGAVINALPEDIHADDVVWAGAVHGPFKNVVVDGDATVKKGTAYGVPLENVAAHVVVAPSRAGGTPTSEVRVSAITATAANGKLTQKAPLVLTTGKRGAFSSGTFVLDNADLDVVTLPDGKDLPVSGVVDVEAVLKGQVSDPRVLLRVAGAHVVFADEDLGDVTAALIATKRELTFQSVDVKSAFIDASSTTLRLDLESYWMNGVVDVAELDLANIENAKSAQLKGRAKGVVVVAGDVRAPGIQADLRVNGFAAADFVFGDGHVIVGVAPDAAGPERSLVVTAAGALSWDLGAWDIRASYALARQFVNAEVKVRDLDLTALRPYLPKEGVVPLDGVINGAVVVAGPLDGLDGSIKLRVPDLIAEVPRSGGAADKQNEKHTLRPFGSVFVDARLDDGALAGRVCAFPDPAAHVDADSPCEGPNRVWAVVAGKLAPLAGAYAVRADVNVDADRVEELVPALLAKDVGLSTWSRVAVRFDKPAATPSGSQQEQKKKNEAPASTVAVSAEIKDLIVRPPGAPVVRIAQPFGLVYTDGRAVIGDTPARFVTARADVDLVIAGGSSVGADDIDVSVDGELALSVLKLFTAEIANASGTASTHIKVSGKFDDGVRIDGTVRPQSGARLTVRSLGQPLVFDDGEIAVTPDPDDPKKIIVSFDTPCSERRSGNCPLRAAFGDGRISLRGNVLARTTRAEDEAWIERFDLAASGTAVEIKTSVGRAEAGFDLTLKGEAPAPVLGGRVEVSDGFFKKDFQIRNFVLSQAPSRPSTPLWQTLTPYGLGGLTFDVDASMQNVRVKARINAFSVDTSLRGELRLSRSLKLPAIDGAIEVEEGTVDFPRARFDIQEMQVQFPTSPEGRINPLVHLAARTELAPGAAGNDVEVPIDLSLDGTFDLMQLDMTAVDANHQWSRTELFAYVLFGTVPQSDGGFVNTGVDVASRAALRELAAPVSDELEQLAQSQLGLDVNIDVVSGWQLQLGRRLVVEGQGFLSQGISGTDSATTTTTTSTNGTDALRVRLLFYDHLPIGKSVSAEGRFGAVSDLRLSFRVFEE